MLASTASAQISATERFLGAITLLLVICPLLLVTRNMFDGASTTHAEMLGSFDGLYYWTTNANWPLAVAFYKICNLMAVGFSAPILFIIKMLVVALVLGLYFELVQLGRALFSVSERESRLMALLCVVSPSFYTLVSTTIAPILLCVWLVFIGHRLFRSLDTKFRWVGLVLLALSFQLASNLVMSVALELVFMLRFSQYRKSKLIWLGILIATAVTVYASMRLLSPPKLIFTEHNLLLNPLNSDDLRRIVKATLMFLTWGVIPLTALLLATLAAFFSQGGFKIDKIALKNYANWQPLLVCFFLCIAAAFPYVMVGKGPPLFTLRSLGDGVTEQVLRAAHTGWFAPTWANTSGRHGFLYSISIALLSWQVASLVFNLLSTTPRMRRPVSQFLVLVFLFMSWTLPAYYNKLEHQYTELSLLKAFKMLPAAPAGIIEVHYKPVTDYLIWTNAAGVILRQAWGRSDYYAMFHSVPVHLADMQWAYHAYLKDTGLLDTPMMQNFNAMSNFPGEKCFSKYEAQLPQPSWFGVTFAGLSFDLVDPAVVTVTHSGCEPAYELPNPTPGKKIIP